MTELIPDKRYRWTVEGISDGKGLWIYDGAVYIQGGNLDPKDCELLPDPLPTTPGSAVRHGDKTCTLLDLPDPEDKLWRDQRDDIWRDHDLAGATVLFDAGASRD